MVSVYLTLYSKSNLIPVNKQIEIFSRSNSIATRPSPVVSDHLTIHANKTDNVYTNQLVTLSTPCVNNGVTKRGSCTKVTEHCLVQLHGPLATCRIVQTLQEYVGWFKVPVQNSWVFSPRGAPQGNRQGNRILIPLYRALFNTLFNRYAHSYIKSSILYHT